MQSHHLLQIEDLIERFNFEKVLVAMQALDWKWVTTTPSGTVMEIPTISRMKETAERLLIRAAKDKAVCGSGGFEAEYFPECEPDSEMFRLKFILTETDTEYFVLPNKDEK